MKAFNFYKDAEFKEVNIILDSPVTFEDIRKNFLKIHAGKLTLPVVPEKQLIIIKKHAGRPVDKFDIQELESLKKLRKRQG